MSTEDRIPNRRGRISRKASDIPAPPSKTTTWDSQDSRDSDRDRSFRESNRNSRETERNSQEIERTTNKSGYQIFRMVAKTISGLEEQLAGELQSLGAERINPMGRSVEFYGTQALLYRANICCRLATRILRPVATFVSGDGESLYKGMDTVNWSDYLQYDSTLAIDPVVSYSTFNNTHFVAQKAKDAVVDQLRTEDGLRPSVDTRSPDLRINIHIHENNATVSLDSSGDPLHKRGYRIEAGKAPLNEVCAAGIIALTGWDGTVPLMDGMCGSGTLLIEAVMKARNIAPGLIRQDYGFMRWNDFERNLYDKEYYSAKNKVKRPLSVDVTGSDNSPGRIRDAATNIAEAGLTNDINLERKRFEDQEPKGPGGVLVMNPPYGERLKSDSLNDLYSAVGDRLKQKFQGYEAHIFTGNPEAAGNIGLRASRRIKLFNGPIECRLLKFEMYEGSRKERD